MRLQQQANNLHLRAFFNLHLLSHVWRSQLGLQQPSPLNQLKISTSLQSPLVKKTAQLIPRQQRKSNSTNSSSPNLLGVCHSSRILAKVFLRSPRRRCHQARRTQLNFKMKVITKLVLGKCTITRRQDRTMKT